MPYGCALNEYSSGLCQLLPASYQPYPRSTAVSSKEHNVPFGISEDCFLPNASFCLTWHITLMHFALPPFKEGS